MPELPEVEIQRRNLARWSAGRVVAAVETPDLARFEGDARLLPGRRFVGWERRGKLLHGRLEGGVILQSHLGMTGQWVADPAHARPGVRVVLTLASGGHPERVGLVDPRRFGRTTIFAPGDPAAAAAFERLGPDALDAPMTPDELRRRLGARATPLRTRLLDQAVIAGLGNIAVTEIAWRARVHPHTAVGALDVAAVERLAAAIRGHIAYVLDVETADEIAYLGSAGAHNPFFCYGREGEPCPRCGVAFLRGAMGGRPSFWCPRCQAPPQAAA